MTAAEIAGRLEREREDAAILSACGDEGRDAGTIRYLGWRRFTQRETYGRLWTLCRAGLVEHMPSDGVYPPLWRITDLGRRALAARDTPAPKEPSCP